MVECVNCAKFKGCNFSNPYLHECVDYQETQTNEQWIKQCTTEQLAEWLAFLVYDVICKNGGRSVEEEDTEYWLEWLKGKRE